ncbi:hypothetical protein B0H19DRAFT_1149139, partial [Mycena capillaripes]
TPKTPAESLEGTGPVVNLPSFSHTASTVPRLISVVEIIKREYLKKLELEPSGALLGLHQYNEGIPQDADSVLSKAIIAALEGKTHLKTKQTPFMNITLSRLELPELTGATYQPPLERKLSKSAKARAKRREKMAADGEAD